MTLPAKEKLTTIMTVYELQIHANLSEMATSTRRAALYVRVSTSDKGQTVENQLQPVQEAAGRLGWTGSTATRSVAPNGVTSQPGRIPWLKGVARASSDCWECSANSSER